MISQWIKSLDKKSSSRTENEIDEIFLNLKAFRIFQRLHPVVLRDLCRHACIEFLEKSVFLFKQGDEALNWYGVLSGSLDIRISHTGRINDTVTLCTLGVGTACDDSVLTGTSKTHSVSAITNEKCTLIRVKRDTFRELYEQNLQLIENNATSPINESLMNYSFNTSLPSKQIRSYSQSCSSISGRQSTSPEISRSNMLAVDFKEGNSEILTIGGSSRNSFSSVNTEITDLLIDNKVRHLSEGQIDKLGQSINKEYMNQLNHNQSSSSTNLKSNFSFNQATNFEQSNQQSDQINQNIVDSKQDAFNKRKSFRRLTIRRSSYRMAGSSAYEESDINSTVLRVAKVLRTLIQYKAPYLIRDRCLESPTNNELDANNNNYSTYLSAQQQTTQRDIFTRCMVGTEMVDWLLSISANTTLRLHSRFQAASMWQVLMEENVLKMVPNRLAFESGNQGFFEDKYVFYRFCFDTRSEDNSQADQQTIEFQTNETNNISIERAESEILHCLQLLSKLGLGAMFRKALQKTADQRTLDEIDLIYMQLMHVKPLSPLSNLIRQELAKVVTFELHRKAGSIVFNQGEKGTSWYIILKGSVNVLIMGKGIVCTLNDGDDFGKLAVMNDTARAATIITNEDNCQFLKVSKFHFDKIIRDAEANTIRLKEHGNEVLVLQKMATKSEDENDKEGKTSFKYMVMSGVPEKICEYLIETKIDVTSSFDYLYNSLLDRNAEQLMSRGSLLMNVFDSSLTSSDTFLEDFLLTYQIYLSNFTLSKFLLKYYKIDHSTLTNNNNSNTKIDQKTPKQTKSANASIPANKTEFMILNKRKVIRFIKIWLQVAKEPFFCDNHIINFLNEINELLEEDSIRYPQLHEEVLIFNQILESKQIYDEEMENRGVKKWKSDAPGPIRRLSINGVTCNLINTKSTKPPSIQPTLTRTNSFINKNIFTSLANINNRNSIAALTNTLTSPFNVIAANSQQTLNTKTTESEFFTVNRRINVIRAKDEMISRVYCPDHTYTTLKLPVDSTAQVIKMLAAEKLGLINKPNTSDENLESNGKDKQTVSAEFILVEIKSNGERILFKDTEVSIQTGLSVNGRIFVSLIDHLDALTPLPEQQGPTQSSFHILAEFSEVQLAYYLTYYSWSLLQNVHEYELIYQVFGRHNFSQITANLDVFLKHFNEVQYWVATEIVLQDNLAKRVHLVKKFIKVASICKDYQNLNTFFGIIMGLNNIAVSRLTQTWEKISSKLRKLLSQFESLIDPSRNHRKYRTYLSKLSSPIIPFCPLLLKDMTFSHEGNLTFIGKGMINFEKMHMVAQTLRVIKYCKSKPLSLENITLTNTTSSTTLTPQFQDKLCKIDTYIRDLKVIDNQRILNQLSHRIEHRK